MKHVHAILSMAPDAVRNFFVMSTIPVLRSFVSKTSVTLRRYKGFSVNYVLECLGKKHSSEEIRIPYRNHHTKVIKINWQLTRPSVAQKMQESHRQYRTEFAVLHDSFGHHTHGSQALCLGLLTTYRSEQLSISFRGCHVMPISSSRLVTNIYFQITSCYIIRTNTGQYLGAFTEIKLNKIDWNSIDFLLKFIRSDMD